MLAGLAGLTAIGVSFWAVWSPETSTTFEMVMPPALAVAAVAASEPEISAITASATPTGLMIPPPRTISHTITDTGGRFQTVRDRTGPQVSPRRPGGNG